MDTLCIKRRVKSINEIKEKAKRRRRKKEHKKQKHKNFCHAFYKKRAGVGGAHERKAKQKRNKEEQSEAIFKKIGKEKYVKNAKHSQTGIFLADRFTQREIPNK